MMLFADVDEQFSLNNIDSSNMQNDPTIPQQSNSLTPQVSLHAIAGHNNLRTLRISRKD